MRCDSLSIAREAHRNDAAIGIVHSAGPSDQALTDRLVQREDRRLAALRVFGQYQLPVGSVFALELIADGAVIGGVIVGADHIARGLPRELEHCIARADRATVLLDGAVGVFIEGIDGGSCGGLAGGWRASDQRKHGNRKGDEEFHDQRDLLRAMVEKNAMICQ